MVKTKELLMGNYLRVRGEYTPPATPQNNPPELPPRARRIPNAVNTRVNQLGTTSACAENTLPGGFAKPGLWNYLRVRGEYKSMFEDAAMEWELPPRARRIP